MTPTRRLRVDPAVRWGADWGMKTSFLLPALFGVCFTFQLAAVAQDDARAQTEQLIEKAKRAKAEGRGDEAEELMKRAKELRVAQMKEGDRERQREGDEKSARLKREIEELRAAGKNEEADRLIARIKGEREGQAPDRIQHVMQAVGHLRAAGLKEPAEHLEQMARQMREEGEHRDSNAGAPPPEWQRMMRETHAQLERMQLEIEELRAAAKSRAGKD